MSLRGKYPLWRIIPAKAVYWAIFGPLVLICAPFILLKALVSWVEWTASGWIADLFQPVGYHWHKLARAAGNAVLGYRPE